MSLGRRQRQPSPRPGNAGDGPYLREQATAVAYTRKWHRVRDWGLEIAGLWDIVPAHQPNPRIAIVRAALVKDISDAEEAFERGIPLQYMKVTPGPTRIEGGLRRRVLVRIHTWIPDVLGEVGFSPQWIVAGHGMTARTASAAFNRYVRDYAMAVSRGIESRRL